MLASDRCRTIDRLHRLPSTRTGHRRPAAVEGAGLARGTTVRGAGAAAVAVGAVARVGVGLRVGAGAGAEAAAGAGARGVDLATVGSQCHRPVLRPATVRVRDGVLVLLPVPVPALVLVLVLALAPPVDRSASSVAIRSTVHPRDTLVATEGQSFSFQLNRIESPLGLPESTQPVCCVARDFGFLD